MDGTYSSEKDSVCLANWWLLLRFQACFREGHNIEEQLVRLSQEVWKSFQARDRTVIILFDLCRAYDKVWRDGLLWKLSGAGVDVPVIRWVQS